MPDRTDRDFIEDIEAAIEKIYKYINDKSFEEFKEDDKTVDAVIRNFEIIGEAAGNLSPEFREKHEGVNWRGVVDFRNVMIGGYFEIQKEVLWQTYKKNLPELKKYLKKIQQSNQGDSDG